MSIAWSAKHYGRAVPEWNMFDSVKHTKKKHASKKSLKEGARSNPNRTKKNLVETSTLAQALRTNDA